MTPNFDELFDILNSRNPFGTGFKSPMRKTNRDRWEKALQNADNYIRKLKETTGKMVRGKAENGICWVSRMYRQPEGPV